MSAVARYAGACRQVAETDVDGVRVSTVWLGGEFRWPYETILLRGGQWDGRTQERCATEAEALEQHARVVAQVRP